MQRTYLSPLRQVPLFEPGKGALQNMYAPVDVPEGAVRISRRIDDFAFNPLLEKLPFSCRCC